MTNPRRARGQAIVEATLSILVFITVLVFGIHFAEVTMTQMKVTEAGQAAVWDSTSGEMHSLPLSFGAVNSAIGLAQTNTAARYADFEGRQNATPATRPQGLFSSARPGSLNVRCNTGVGLGHRASSGFMIAHEFLVYTDNNGMRCQADALIDPFGTMKVQAGLNDFKFFAKSANATRASNTGSSAYAAGYHACEVGRWSTASGGCRGNFDMMIDDWGLAGGSQLGGSEDSQCPVLPFGFPCVGGNMPFWTSAYLMYTFNSLLFRTQDRSDYRMVSLISAPPRWAWFNIPYAPGSPTSFYMSFMGEDLAFIQIILAGDASLFTWFTTPFGIWHLPYTWGYIRADDCYLGKRNCNMGGALGNPIANP